ncbi:MAG: hypothetical protein ACM37W_22905 [Actinomycetota bacterium]
MAYVQVNSDRNMNFGSVYGSDRSDACWFNTSHSINKLLKKLMNR